MAISDLLYSWALPRDLIFCWLKGLRRKSDWRFWGLPLIQTRRRGSVSIGKSFVACSNPRHNSLGVFQPVTIKTLRPESRITIGNNVGISGATISSAANVDIGDNVLIGSGAMITDNDAHPINPEKRMSEAFEAIAKPVKIENDVFIGARSVILKGVTIGKGSVVGAGSVVTNDVEAYAIVAGNPARKVGDSRTR
ncbi:MAG: acyltransferase [Desulfobacteraceae bacterium 4572_88]|nr:MAG: acyltransferase [Desulfobacteraceae bacterium 4572_88]RLC21971.1 MAG: acyltransferase [Deltaproteobacteria bacterium]